MFDRYDVVSLKESTRERRKGGKLAIIYRVEDNTTIEKVSAKKFLSSTKMKDQLTVYLTKKALHHCKKTTMTFIVISRKDVMSNSVDI